MSYSSLFAAGLDTAGRFPIASNRDLIGYHNPRAKDYTRRPSADTDSLRSRRSSMPTLSSAPSSDRRNGADGSNNVPFIPSVLLRSDTTTTKRSHFQSFLSMDANDPLPSNLRFNTVPISAATNPVNPPTKSTPATPNS